MVKEKKFNYKLFLTLYKKAVKKHGHDITPCNGKSWLKCFNQHGLWYNTADGSTHLIERTEL